MITDSIKKILYFIIFYISIFSFSQTFVVGASLIGYKDMNRVTNVVKNLFYPILTLLYQEGFKSPIFYTGKYLKSDKIDIIVANHLNALDLVIYLSVIRQYDDRNVYYIMKKGVTLVPGVGIVLSENNDIKLSRKLDEDENILKESLAKITSGIIVIYPEGTRYSNQKQKECVEYSKKNNLPIFNNVLYPKMKGLWIITNELIRTNKMGNIIDFTMMIEKLKGKDGLLSTILTQDFGNTYAHVNTYTIDTIDTIDTVDSYDNFKLWFLKIWEKKDKIMNTMGTLKDTNKYNNIKSTLKSSDYMLFILVTSLFIYMMVKSKGLYLPISLVFSYIIVIINNRKI